MFRKIFAVMLMVLPVLAGAGTLDDIARLEQGKDGGAPVASQDAPAGAKGLQKEQNRTPLKPVWFHLTDGRSVDISHWQVVHFIRSDCPYCHRFNPVLKSVAGQVGIGIFVYSFDGVGDAVFPHVLPVNDGILKDFFAELPQATPTDFIINTQSLVTIPLSQGELTEDTLKQRLDESFALADRLGVL